jgi:hypothetical protein
MLFFIPRTPLVIKYIEKIRLISISKPVVKISMRRAYQKIRYRVRARIFTLTAANVRGSVGLVEVKQL